MGDTASDDDKGASRKKAKEQNGASAMFSSMEVNIGDFQGKRKSSPRKSKEPEDQSDDCVRRSSMQVNIGDIGTSSDIPTDDKKKPSPRKAKEQDPASAA